MGIGSWGQWEDRIPIDPVTAVSAVTKETRGRNKVIQDND